MQISRHSKSTELARAIGATLLLLSLQAWADQPTLWQRTEIHGFAALGYIDTTGNNFYGHTRNGGATDYYEAGINLYSEINSQVSVAGQLISRRAGETDDGRVRVDYGFVDLHSPRQEQNNFGLRLGRVRNPIGLYNETRDVLFTRPSILLPQSIYLEGTGVRELMFSTDAVQFYADQANGNSQTSFKLSLGASERASDQTHENFAVGLPPGTSLSIDIKHPVFAQVLHEIDGGQKRFAVSVANIGVAGSYTSAFIPKTNFDLDTMLYVFSGQYNAENWTLTSEYQVTYLETRTSGTTTKAQSDGIYLQYQYRFTPEWTAMLRQDWYYPNRHERGNSVARDSSIGLTWRPARNWQVNAEYHHIGGTAGIPVPDNPNGIAPHTNLFALMVGVRF